MKHLKEPYEIDQDFTTIEPTYQFPTPEFKD